MNHEINNARRVIQVFEKAGWLDPKSYLALHPKELSKTGSSKPIQVVGFEFKKTVLTTAGKEKIRTFVVLLRELESAAGKNFQPGEMFNVLGIAKEIVAAGI